MSNKFIVVVVVVYTIKPQYPFSPQSLCSGLNQLNILQPTTQQLCGMMASTKVMMEVVEGTGGELQLPGQPPRQLKRVVLASKKAKQARRGATSDDGTPMGGAFDMGPTKFVGQVELDRSNVWVALGVDMATDAEVEQVIVLSLTLV